MKENILKILEYAVHAPSGDNSQPWRFEVKGNKIYQYNLPDNDNVFLNFRQNGSHVSHGSVIENIVIASSNYGYGIKVKLFPLPEDSNLVAVLELSKTNISKDVLFDFIKKRCTNRRPYESKAIKRKDLDTLIFANKSIHSGNLLFVTNKNDMKTIGVTATLMERIALENKLIHKLFFSGIVWTDKEHQEKKRGLYLKALELPLFVQYLFRIIKNWRAMSFLSYFGFPGIAAKGNATINMQSAAFGMITTKGVSPENFVIAGRAMQRVWLETARLGFALQPVTGLLFLAHRVDANETKGLNDAHCEMIKNGIVTLKKIFHINNETPVMMFRVGYAEKPSAFSLRNKPNVVFSNN